MKRSIVKLLAVGLMLGGAVIPTTFANSGSTPQITTEQTAKAATTDTAANDKSQTISYAVYKTGTTNSSVSSQYFNKTAKVTPNGNGGDTVTLSVQVPKYLGITVGVDIQTMDGKTVTSSDSYQKDGKTWKDLTFTVDDPSELNNTLNATMTIKPGILTMHETADFKFDTSTLKNDASTDVKPTTPADPEAPIISDPTGTGTTAPSTSDDNGSSNVVIGDPVTTDSNATTKEQDIPYQVLKADASQGESVSTQFFTGTSKVTKNDDGTYKVAMTMTYPTSFGTQPVTINSINGESTNPDDTKTYSQDGKNFMDFSFNINSLSDLDNLIPCSMTIDVSNLGFNSDESVNFKFNATSSGVDASSAVGSNGSGSATSPNGVYGSASSDWPSSGTGSASAANPSTSNSTLPQTSNANNSIVLTMIGLAVATMSVVLYKRTFGLKD